MKLFVLLVITLAALVVVSEGAKFCQHGRGRGRGSRYRGKANISKSGFPCQKWTAQKPHKHTRTPKKYRGKGLGNHNYCRNPDGGKGAWCYTLNPKKRWEHCRVHQCHRRLGCQKGKGKKRGHRYRGRMRVTKSGRVCQKWTSQKPHKHTNTPAKRHGMGLGNHNYCRNPTGSTVGAWCYTTDKKKRWEQCAVPVCRG